MVSSDSWKLEGDYFEGCNCKASCRCVYLDAPDEGNCKVSVAWHITRGHYGSTSLGGLNVVGVFHSPGHMVQGPKWSAALYLDAKANAEQAAALGKIFSGQAGGHLAVLTGFVGEIKGVRSVPIRFEAKGRSRSVAIDDVLDLEIEAVGGANAEEDVVLRNPPLGIVPNEDLVVARSKKHHYRDHGLEFDSSGRNGFYSPFTYGP